MGDYGQSFISYIDKQIRNQKQAFGELYIIKDSLPKYDWKLHSDSKIINGYECKKASTFYITENHDGKLRKEIEVWYSTKIPIGIGPVDYVGLPGLVVSSKASNVVYSLESIEKIKSINIKPPTKGTEVTAAEYTSIGLKAVKNLFGK